MLAAAACAAAFAGVFIFAYRIPAGRTADGDIVRALTGLGGSWIGSLASVVSHTAAVVITVAWCAIIYWGIRTGRRREAVAAAALFVIAMAGAEVLKFALNQPRLRTALGLQEAGAHHFPSGHATAATALAFAALVIAPPGYRRFALAAGGAYAVCVCTSVLILGWHLASDVVGGVLLSTFCFCSALAALCLMRERDGRAADGLALRRE